MKTDVYLLHAFKTVCHRPQFYNTQFKHLRLNLSQAQPTRKSSNTQHIKHFFQNFHHARRAFPMGVKKYVKVKTGECGTRCVSQLTKYCNQLGALRDPNTEHKEKDQLVNKVPRLKRNILAPVVFLPVKIRWEKFYQETANLCKFDIPEYVLLTNKASDPIQETEKKQTYSDVSRDVTRKNE